MDSPKLRVGLRHLKMYPVLKMTIMLLKTKSRVIVLIDATHVKWNDTEYQSKNKQQQKK